MTTYDPRPNSVPSLPLDLRLSAIGRRVPVSGPLAGVLAGLVYGDRERDHAETLHFATHARVAEAAFLDRLRTLETATDRAAE